MRMGILPGGGARTAGSLYLRTAAGLQRWLLVCRRVQESGHRWVGATLARVREYCIWSGMEANLRTLIASVSTIRIVVLEARCRDPLGRRSTVSKSEMLYTSTSFSREKARGLVEPTRRMGIIT